MNENTINRVGEIVFVFSFILLLISLVSFVNAEEAEGFSLNYDQTEFSIKISNTIESDAENLIVTLYLFPKKTENQEVSITTTPGVEIKDDEIVFEFDEKGTIELEVRAEVKRDIVIKKISKVGLSEAAKFPEGLEQYAESSVYVLADDPFVKNKAHQLATSDTAKTLYNFAEYVRKNMDYDPDYQEPRNASWIMEEKKGVCSHYTILFMSLVRSVGLATRYVSGVAYSNKEDKCREHAWAEVWIPDYGWVPYDPTLGQYGWLDSSHVVMMYSDDAGRASVGFRYIGEIETRPLEIETDIEKYGKKINLPIDIEIKPLFDEVSLNSYVPLEIKVENPNEYILAIPARISLAPGVSGESEKILFLEPKSKARDYFIIYLGPEHYEKCYDSCIATLEVKDVFENSDSEIIVFEKGAPKITLSEAQHFVSLHGKEAEIDFYCKSLNEYYYNYENVRIECVVENRESTKTLSICNQDVCKEFTIGKDERKNMIIEVPATLMNLTERNTTVMRCLILCVIAMEKKDVMGISCVDLVILERPSIEIATMQNTEADYGSKGHLQAIIESNVETGAELITETREYIEKQNISIEKGTQVKNIPIKTWKLGIGENPIKLTIRYKDKRYKEYESKKDFLFTVRDVSIFERIIIAFSHLFN